MRILTLAPTEKSAPVKAVEIARLLDPDVPMEVGGALFLPMKRGLHGRRDYYLPEGFEPLEVFTVDANRRKFLVISPPPPRVIAIDESKKGLYRLIEWPACENKEEMERMLRRAMLVPPDPPAGMRKIMVARGRTSASLS